MLYIIMHNNEVYMESAGHLLRAGGVDRILTVSHIGENKSEVLSVDGKVYSRMLIASMDKDQYEKLSAVRKRIEEASEKTGESGIINSVNCARMGDLMSPVSFCGAGGRS